MLLPAVLLALAQQPAPAPADFTQALVKAGARDILPVPPGITQITEKTLPEDTAIKMGTQATDDTYHPGMRVLSFLLAPGERLAARQKLHLDLIQLSLAQSVQTGPMVDEVLKVNKIPAGFRARGLQIRNLSSEPYTLILRITGPCNTSYDLEIKRDK
ncbi:hypothetical protein [Geothrix sp. 21YS21S-2]|uniref:hypothetical protein n=1 Tax=Geothrix sp. 21YS21S-2 TaxID=3068893 RepID=UPI0027BA8EA5|nr:hypothetical protein [Geothrix sp. 21YS21S-2]